MKLETRVNGEGFKHHGIGRSWTDPNLDEIESYFYEAIYILDSPRSVQEMRDIYERLIREEYK